MKHRMVSGTGLGANAHVFLNNQGNVPVAFADEVIDFYFPEGFDFQVEDDKVSIGYEPSYQYQDLKIITIHRNKEDSTLMTGHAWGPYGSNVVSKTKRYGDYERRSKFVKFVDKWHPILFSIPRREK